MELIVVILLIGLSLAASRKKKAPGAANRGRAAGSGKVPPVPVDIQQLRRRLESELGSISAQNAASAAGTRAAAPSAAAEAVPAVNTPIVPAGASEEGSSLMDDAWCAGGSMAHSHSEGASSLADEECAGGSMPHSHDEGTERSEQARRMAVLDANNAAQPETRRQPLIQTGEVDIHALRRAVVMAEVLGRPKAMQARKQCHS